MTAEMSKTENKPLMQMPNRKLMFALMLKGHLADLAEQEAAKKPEKKAAAKETQAPTSVAGIQDTPVPSNQRKSDKDKKSELRQKLTTSGNLSSTALTAFFDS